MEQTINPSSGNRHRTPQRIAAATLVFGAALSSCSSEPPGVSSEHARINATASGDFTNGSGKITVTGSYFDGTRCSNALMVIGKDSDGAVRFNVAGNSSPGNGNCNTTTTVTGEASRGTTYFTFVAVLLDDKNNSLACSHMRLDRNNGLSVGQIIEGPNCLSTPLVASGSSPSAIPSLT